jgi:hypothetical protein
MGGIFITQTVVQPNKTLTIRYSLPKQTALQPRKSAICTAMMQVYQKEFIGTNLFVTAH